MRLWFLAAVLALAVEGCATTVKDLEGKVKARHAELVAAWQAENPGVEMDATVEKVLLAQAVNEIAREEGESASVSLGEVLVAIVSALGYVLRGAQILRGA